MLYHRTLRTEVFAHHGHHHGHQVDPTLATVLLEIEDTYSSDRTDGKDKYQRNRKPDYFVEMKKNQAATARPIDLKPFDNLPAPQENVWATFSKGRMAFIVLFDVNQEESLAAAKAVFELLQNRHIAKVNQDNEPVVYVVANKIDQDPMGEEPARVRRMVEAWRATPDQMPFTYMEVSAFEFTKVRRLFRNIVDEVLKRPALYASDAELKAAATEQASTTWGGFLPFGGAAGTGLGFGNLFGGGQ